MHIPNRRGVSSWRCLPNKEVDRRVGSPFPTWKWRFASDVFPDLDVELGREGEVHSEEKRTEARGLSSARYELHKVRFLGEF